MKKAVIFDMDGVLVFTEKFYFNRRMKFFDELKIEPATRKIQDFVGLSSSMVWKMLIPDDEKKREILKERYLEYCTENAIHFDEVINPSVKQLFNKLKDMKVKIAVASSSGKKDILRMIRECRLGSFIDFTISGEECEKSKPSPEIYVKTVNALYLKQEEVLVVEDSTLGIRAGKLAGLKVAALAQSNYCMDQSEADYKINDLMEVADIVL